MDKATEIVIQFHPDGRRFAIWTEEIDLEAAFGKLQTKRASNVERNDATGKWEVTLVGETEPRFSHVSRAECIRWEIAFIHANMTEVMLKHFPKDDARPGEESCLRYQQAHPAKFPCTPRSCHLCKLGPCQFEGLGGLQHEAKRFIEETIPAIEKERAAQHENPDPTPFKDKSNR